MSYDVVVFVPDGIAGEVAAERALHFAADAAGRGCSKMTARMGDAYVELEQHPDVDGESLEDADIHQVNTTVAVN